MALFAITERLRAMGPGEQATLIRRLLQLESARLNLPIGSSRVSQRVTVGDGGEDGIILGVPAEGTPLPAGDTLLQLKTNNKVTALKKTLKKELKDAERPKAMLEAGGNYIVVWSEDANGKEVDDLVDAMVEVLGEQHRDRIDVWGLGPVEELCNLNAAVLVELGLIPGLGILPFDQWAQGQVSDISGFVPDEERTRAIERIRKAIDEEADPHVLHVRGDAGVGKSRVLREALNVDDVRDQVVVGDGESVLEFVRYVATNPKAHCILVADEIDSSDIDHLRKQILPAQGRIRLITAGLPGSARNTKVRDNDIELGTLDDEALHKLVLDELALPEKQADWVVEISKGYPRLAYEVAKVVKADSKVASIGQAITAEGIHQLLGRMIASEELQRQLGVISLFSQVGVDGARENEIRAVADAFDFDYAVLAGTINDEIGRFVSRSGSLRSVTPKLVAVWLAGQVLLSEGAGVAEKIASLPAPLPERFNEQLGFLKDAPRLETILKELLARPEFEDPAGFDQAAAGFLRAAAAVVPEQVAKVLKEVFDEIADEALVSGEFPRRDVVWTLEFLLWHATTYDFAMSALLRLAEHETEDFSNNASGVLTDSFQTMLGGTTMPFMDRLRWFDEQAVDEMSDRRRRLLAGCAAAGLRLHQTRMHGSLEDESGLKDWRPSTRDEATEATRESWARLVILVDGAEGDTRVETFADLAGSVREGIEQGAADEVLADLLSDRWSVDERAKLAAPLRDIVKYDLKDADDDLSQKVISAIESLMGDTFQSQLEATLRSPVWDLHENDDWESTPPSIVKLAEQAAESPDSLTEALAVTSRLDDLNTAYSFWREVAARTDTKELAEMALTTSPPVLVAYQAALSVGGAKDPDWADAQFREAVTDPARASSAIALVQAIGLTDDRAELLLAAVDRGEVEAAAFTQLLYGASVRSLSFPIAMTLIEVLASAGTPAALEHALGIVSQYAEVTDGFLDDPGVQGIVTKIAVEALAFSEGGTMRTHYAYEIAKSLPPAMALEILEARVRNDRTLPDSPEAKLLDQVFEEDPKVATGWAMSLLDDATSGDYRRWAHWAENLSLLSRIGKADPNQALDWFLSHEQPAQARLLRHVDFSAAKPPEFLVELLESLTDDALLGEAGAGYFNSLGVVSGPFHLGLQRQLDRLLVWRGTLGPNGKHWVDRQVKSLERQIAQEKIRDEEDDALLGRGT